MNRSNHQPGPGKAVRASARVRHVPGSTCQECPRSVPNKYPPPPLFLLATLAVLALGPGEKWPLHQKSSGMSPLRAFEIPPTPPFLLAMLAVLAPGPAKSSLPRKMSGPPIPCSLFPIPYSLSLFPVPCSLFPIPCSLFPVPCFPTPRILLAMLATLAVLAKDENHADHRNSQPR